MTEDQLEDAGRGALAACKSALSRDALTRHAPLVEAYVLGVDLLARMQAEHERLGFPVVSVGVRGHVAAHPLPGEIRRQGRAVQELAKALGLTRADRSMVGRNTRAPDRLAKLRSVG